jgi:nucleoside-diphosphate-sugar epimerase
MTRVLITGASGFIGGYCLRRLLAEECEIHAVSRAAGHGDSGGRVKWHRADLRDGAQTVALIAAIRPTHLLHSAWVATPHLYADSPENVDWLQATITLAVAFGADGGHRFVGLGSSAEYDPGDRVCVEDETSIRPATIYGRSKAASWLAVEAVAQLHGFAAAWGRLFAPYGRGDASARLIPSVVAALRAGRPIDLTHGAQRRDFIDVTDAADLLVRLLLSRASGVFNIGTGAATTVRAVVEYLADRCGRRELLRFGTLAPPAGEPACLVADPTKVRDRLGWAAPTSLHDGLDGLLQSSSGKMPEYRAAVS